MTQGCFICGAARRVGYSAICNRPSCAAQMRAMIARTSIRIPRRFYEDHRERDLPTPRAIKETKRHVWIDPHDEDALELLSDARYYASEARYFDPPMPGLARSAAATVRQLEWIELISMES